MEISTEGNDVTVIESLCINCHKNGTSKFLLTRIPHFKDVVISAFECDFCHYRNAEVQSTGSLAEKGKRFVVNCSSSADLNRQVVKGEGAVIEIPELQFEIPASSNTTLTTIEEKTVRDLQSLEESNPALYEQVRPALKALIEYKNGGCFTFCLDDASGNSYVESLSIGKEGDERMKVSSYERTPEQVEKLGYATENPVQKDENQVDSVHAFPADCSACGAHCQTRMHLIEIPYFKEVIIMSTSCDACGFKSNEIKCGGAISPLAKRITFKMTGKEDLSRDVLKSETCELRIPEIDLELRGGTLGGRFTTLEGLLTQITEELNVRVPFVMGDSADADRKAAFASLIANLKEICEGRRECTIILDDPMANSYLQNLWAPDEDPNILVEEYERTWEQNEEYGLNDMKTEDYQ